MSKITYRTFENLYCEIRDTKSTYGTYDLWRTSPK